MDFFAGKPKKCDIWHCFSPETDAKYMYEDHRRRNKGEKKMGVHIHTEQGKIADVVLMPGDPLRAKLIAEKYLENAECYNEVRGMYGYTGTYKGKRVSVQGSGMGVPSFSIYAHELIKDYNCKTLIRIGSCGAMKNDVKVKDLVFAMGACTDSSIITNYFGNATFAPIGNFELLSKAVLTAKDMKVNYHVGNVFTSDLFYNYKENALKPYMDFGVLAVEMEVAALYMLAAQFDIKALGIMTVSDHVLTGESMPPIDRERTLDDMIKLALEVAIAG